MARQRVTFDVLQPVKACLAKPVTTERFLALWLKVRRSLGNSDAQFIDPRDGSPIAGEILDEDHVAIVDWEAPWPSTI